MANRRQVGIELSHNFVGGPSFGGRGAKAQSSLATQKNSRMR